MSFLTLFQLGSVFHLLLQRLRRCLQLLMLLLQPLLVPPTLMHQLRPVGKDSCQGMPVR